MRVARTAALLPVILLASAQPNSQQTTTTTVLRDPQGLAVLQQAVAASGGTTLLSSIQDFAATGTITYFWAGQDVKGSVKLLGRGLMQFRLDATLPDGVRSWVVSNGAGSLAETGGTVRAIPYHNAINLGSLTFPFFSIIAALQDSTTTVSDLGIANLGGIAPRQVRVVRNLSTQNDPQDSLSKMTTRAFFIDSQTFQLLKIQQITHPSENFTEDYEQEIVFSDYRSRNGVSVPFTITEQIAGQRTWIIQLDEIQFNLGLTDASFAVLNSQLDSKSTSN